MNLTDNQIRVLTAQLADDLIAVHRRAERAEAALATAETGELNNALAAGQACIELSEERKETERLSAALSERDRMLGEAVELVRVMMGGHDAVIRTHIAGQIPGWQKMDNAYRSAPAFLSAYDASKKEGE